MTPFIEAVLNVLTIIALIAAFAFIVILIVDAVLSITNRQGSIFFRRSGEDRPVVKSKSDDEVTIRPTVLESNDQAKTWSEDAAQKEQAEILQKQQNFDEEEQLRLAKEKDIADRQKEFDEFDDFDSLFEEENSNEEAVEEQFDFDAMIEEINNDSLNQIKKTEKADFDEIFNEETTEVVEETEDKSVKVNAAGTVATIEVEQPADADAVVVNKEIANVYEFFPIEALNERLEKLEQRLKLNEKDLKGNKKEYNPLAKVQRNLKRDQAKLRRKEAIIARKKVELYGVNNYVDIDEEKAKKLSEELDLLDGLRLSVQHCEEVMEQNKDRFPILEKANQILVEQNRQIKEDIAEVKAAIAKLLDENK